MFLSRKSRDAIKGTIREIENKQRKLTCEWTPLGKYKQDMINKLK